MGISLRWRRIDVGVCMYIDMPKLLLKEIHWTKLTEQFNSPSSGYAGIS